MYIALRLNGAPGWVQQDVGHCWAAAAQAEAAAQMMTRRRGGVPVSDGAHVSGGTSVLVHLTITYLHAVHPTLLGGASLEVDGCWLHFHSCQKNIITLHHIFWFGQCILCCSLGSFLRVDLNLCCQLLRGFQTCGRVDIVYTGDI